MGYSILFCHLEEVAFFQLFIVLIEMKYLKYLKIYFIDGIISSDSILIFHIVRFFFTKRGANNQQIIFYIIANRYVI